MTLVYDLPTRIFHFVFAVLFVFSFSIGKFVDDDSSLYSYHMLSGFMMVFSVALRIIWGFVGTKYAKFSSFLLHPRSLIIYFKNLFFSKTKRQLGHNSASSFAAVIMYVLTILLVLSGVSYINGGAEYFEEIHELFANLFLFTVIGHILGILLHQFKHRDAIGMSMFSGMKHEVKDETGISKSHISYAIIYIVLLTSFTYYLGSSYNTQNSTLNILGSKLVLAKAEHHKEECGNEYEEYDDD